MDHLTIRYAHESDIPQILYFIKRLAIYEDMPDDVVATEDLLREWIFEKQKAEVLLAEEDGIPVGFALFFHNFSTFLGRAGIYPDHDLLGMDTPMTVLLPEKRECRPELEPGKKYPVLYLLHGHAYFDYLTKELPVVVANLFPASTKREDTYIVGLSMGGYGAMKAALACPEQYGHAASMSGASDFYCALRHFRDMFSVGDFMENIDNVFGGEDQFYGSEQTKPLHRGRPFSPSARSALDERHWRSAPHRNSKGTAFRPFLYIRVFSCVMNTRHGAVKQKNQ